MAAVTICSDFGAPQNKVSHCFHCSLSICHEVMGSDGMTLVFRMLSFKPTFFFFPVQFLREYRHMDSIFLPIRTRFPISFSHYMKVIINALFRTTPPLLTEGILFYFIFFETFIFFSVFYFFNFKIFNSYMRSQT